MNTPIHPLPWTWEERELSDGCACVIYDASGYRVGQVDHLNRETASFIVTAANTHDDLIWAAKAAVIVIDSVEKASAPQKGESLTLLSLIAAIEKAEGR